LGGDTTASISVEGGGASPDDAAALDAKSVDAGTDRTGAVGDAPNADATLEASVADASHRGDSAAAFLVGLRVANWSPDAPAVDFCLAVHGTGVFQGPVLAGPPGAQSEGGTMGAAGIAFLQASTYSLVTPGQYDLRLVVAAGAVDCSMGGLLLPDAVTLPDLKTGSTLTVALVGEANPVANHPPLQLVWFADDFVGPPPGKPRPDGAPNDKMALRFIHAAPGVGSVAFGFDQSGGSQWPFLGVSFGRANSAPDGGSSIFDSNGYLVQSPPLMAATLRVAPTPRSADSGVPDMPDLATASTISDPRPTVMNPNVMPRSLPLSAANGSVVTVVLVGNTTTGGAPQLLMCIDSSGTNIDTANPSAPYSLCIPSCNSCLTCSQCLQ
jgi:hypothetical protein